MTSASQRPRLSLPRHSAAATVLVAAAIVGAAPARGGESAPHVDFARDVYPIFRKACFECHGPDQQEGGLRLDARASAYPSAALLVPGEPQQSELVRRITLPEDDPERMPATGDRLAPADVEQIRLWIKQGAAWPDEVEVAEHWAYVLPSRPPLPSLEDDQWPKNAVDHFVLARLEQEGMQPSREADRPSLIRRLYLDLTGLPPSPQELAACLADTSAGAYERLVDELLARPEFGERWARPWLDLARYADSHGFQRDDLRDSWAYRDWVIDAINADMPFDQFTIEQIAGDLLPDSTEAQQIATGFHRCTPVNVEAGSHPEETRVNQVIDRVNTTATVWLGTTLECAQCHDHKYDPFSQREYYQLFAFFNSTQLEADRSNPNVPGSIRFLGPSMELSDPERSAQRLQVEEERTRLRRAVKKRRRTLAQELDTRVATLAAAGSDEALPPDVAEAFSLAPSEWSEQQRARLEEYCASTDPMLRRLNAKLGRLEKQLASLAPPTTLVMRELPQPRQTHIFRRGDYRTPGAAVDPGTPAVLHPLVAGPPNRLTLARWLVSDTNPLVARVTVNRLWAEIFGHGIVTTPEDFGIQGEPPTHPELLDWLAVELRDNGWSRKHILKTIVMSATYRQSANVTPELLARDAPNLLYARGPRFRMDAEMIRDNALAIAGAICLVQRGPPIRPYQPDGIWTKIGGQKYDYVTSPGGERYRRGIYVVLKRGAPYPSFANFDATARLACTVQRSSTNTPLQALTLLNDPVFVEAAQMLACRILTEQPDADASQRLRYAFRLCTARDPDPCELDTLQNLYKEQLCASRNASENTRRLFANVSTPASCPPAELTAWYAVATALLNLDETITK